MAENEPPSGGDIATSLDVSAIAREIAQGHFGIQQVDALEPLPGHGHVFLVRSPGSPFVEKCVLDSGRWTERLRYTHELVMLLNERGFATYSLIQAVGGGTLVYSDGLIWEMHTYVSGHPLGSLALDPSGVGRLLGEYHRTAEQIALEGFPVPEAYRTGGVESADPRLVLTALSTRLRSSEALDGVNCLMDLSRSLSEGLNAGDSAIPLHGDISASNILARASRHFLIDFEDVAWGHPCIDVAQALARLVAACQQRGCDSAHDAVFEFLSSYESSSSFAMRPSARLKAVAALHAIKDWACDQLSSSLPDQSLPATLPLLRLTLDLISRCLD